MIIFFFKNYFVCRFSFFLLRLICNHRIFLFSAPNTHRVNLLAKKKNKKNSIGGSDTKKKCLKEVSTKAEHAI
jgi:hypothetical protein